MYHNGISTSRWLKKKQFGDDLNQEGKKFEDRWLYRDFILSFNPLPENSLQEPGWSQDANDKGIITD